MVSEGLSYFLQAQFHIRKVIIDISFYPLRRIAFPSLCPLLLQNPASQDRKSVQQHAFAAQLPHHRTGPEGIRPKIPHLTKVRKNAVLPAYLQPVHNHVGSGADVADIDMLESAGILDGKWHCRQYEKKLPLLQRPASARHVQDPTPSCHVMHPIDRMAPHSLELLSPGLQNEVDDMNGVIISATGHEMTDIPILHGLLLRSSAPNRHILSYPFKAVLSTIRLSFSENAHDFIPYI